ncbi:flagellar basal body rod protein FlgB [Zooshikella sp. RANM57]|uniref:flagellar basal body rod protein FlgB n=1 Tax=Zooshikella sp. RANM57 TaxID=3425863 RepID=UPI003D6F699A
MAISFDNALGVHPYALQVRAARAEIIANNFANADTPGFKARDIDFKQALKQAVDNTPRGNQLPLNVTNEQHIQTAPTEYSGPEVLYRTPIQPAIDGNTVDTQQEHSLFARNAMDFQAGFEFLNGSFKSLKTAIKGN